MKAKLPKNAPRPNSEYQYPTTWPESPSYFPNRESLKSYKQRMNRLQIPEKDRYDPVSPYKDEPKSNMPKGGTMTVKGDIGAMRQAESTKVGGFKDGPTVKTEGKFGSHSDYKRAK